MAEILEVSLSNVLILKVMILLSFFVLYSTVSGYNKEAERYNQTAKFKTPVYDVKSPLIFLLILPFGEWIFLLRSRFLRLNELDEGLSAKQSAFAYALRKYGLVISLFALSASAYTYFHFQFIWHGMLDYLAYRYYVQIPLVIFGLLLFFMNVTQIANLKHAKKRLASQTQT